MESQMGASYGIDPRSGASLPPPRPCDRCGSGEASVAFRSDDFISGESFDLLRCLNCGLLRTDFRGSSSDLARYYGSAYYSIGGRRLKGTLKVIMSSFRSVRARWVARRAAGPGKILDLGCGRGFMLASMKRMGWDCMGTEIASEVAVAAGDEYGLKILSEGIDPLPFPEGHFDVVTSWHSLEHMERPVRTLGDIHRVLRPGGLFMVEVPNRSSLQAAMGGSRWFHLDPPRHLYHFTRGALRSILVDLGFEVVWEGTFSAEQGPFGMAQSLLNRLTFSRNVLYQLVGKPGARVEDLLPGPMGKVRAAWNTALTIFLAAPAALLGASLEVAACMAGRGGVVRIVARKVPPPAP
jgi:SAM-dependent methyltransferase